MKGRLFTAAQKGTYKSSPTPSKRGKGKHFSDTERKKILHRCNGGGKNNLYERKKSKPKADDASCCRRAFVGGSCRTAEVEGTEPMHVNQRRVFDSCFQSDEVGWFLRIVRIYVVLLDDGLAVLVNYRAVYLR